MVFQAILALDPLVDFAELSRDLVRDRWQQVITLWGGWDGVDGRCRIDSGSGPFRE